MKHLKRLIAVSAVLCFAVVFALTVSAAEVSVKVNVTGGSCSVSVTQNGVPLAGSDGNYVADSNAGGVSVTATPNVGSYITVAGRNDTTSVSLDISSAPTEIAVDIVVTPIASPSVSLAADTANGGLYYTIGASSTASCMFDVIIMDASGNQVSTFTTTSMSGSIPLSGTVTASQSYTAKASQRVGVNGESGYGSASNSAIAAPLPSKTHILKVSAENGSINAAGGEYSAGERINLLATANKGYSFKEWVVTSGAVASLDNPSTYFTMPEGDAEVKAVFAKSYTLTVKCEQGGKVLTAGGEHFEGTEISLIASCNDGYVFSGWISTDGGSFADATQLETDFTMPANNTTVTAVFVTEQEAANTFALTLTADDGGIANTNRNRAAAGDSVTIRASAKQGYDFVGWTSTSSAVVFEDASSPTTKFTMPESDVIVHASFKANGQAVAGADNNETQTPTDGILITPQKESHLGLWVTIGAVVAIIAIGAAAVAIYLEREEMTLAELIEKIKSKKSRK